MSSRKHLIGLKVLQLSKPNVNKNEIVSPSDGSLPSTLLELPSSFDVYVGEKFSCLYSIYSEHDEAIHVNLKIFVVTPSQQEITLIHPNQPSISEFVLQPHKSIQFTVNYEPKESGQHNLTSSISYRIAARKKEDGNDDAEDDAAADTSNLIANPIVKFIKRNEFSSSQALDVRAKITFVNDNQSIYTFEAEIENISRNTILLESFDLLPGNGWISKSSSSQPSEIVLLPKDVWQIAYIISTDPEATNVSSARPEKFMLAWRREPLGERGFIAL